MDTFFGIRKSRTTTGRWVITGEVTGRTEREALNNLKVMLHNYKYKEIELKEGA